MKIEKIDGKILTSITKKQYKRLLDYLNKGGTDKWVAEEIVNPVGMNDEWVVSIDTIEKIIDLYQRKLLSRVGQYIY